MPNQSQSGRDRSGANDTTQTELAKEVTRLQVEVEHLIAARKESKGRFMAGAVTVMALLLVSFLIWIAKRVLTTL